MQIVIEIPEDIARALFSRSTLPDRVALEGLAAQKEDVLARHFPLLDGASITRSAVLLRGLSVNTRLPSAST